MNDFEKLINAKWSGGGRMTDYIDRQAAIDAADDMVEPQESEDKE